MREQTHVAVIGGGCAGLAAVAALAEKGIAVTLFDASPQLGGRARGVNWKGQRLDNGQHILLGAYSETLRLLSLASVNIHAAILRLPLQLSVRDQFGKNQFNLTAFGKLPAPLHILAGLLNAKGLSWQERYAAIRLMAWLRINNFKLNKDIPLSQLFADKKQPARLVTLLWEPLCLAALNTPLKTASAQVFLNVLRDSFARTKSDSDMLLPRCDLSTLIAEPLSRYIEVKGGVIRHASVTDIVASNDGFDVLADNNSNAHFSHVVLAVSPFRLSAITSQLPTLKAATDMAEQLSYQPIYTVYLQYPEHIKLDLPMTGLTGGLSQWVFDRGQLCNQHGLLAVVISAEGPHQKLTQEALAIEVAKELSAAFPQLPQALWHKVIAEKRATFACEPNLARPAQHTAIKNLYLAGDYTAGDYPATIEGAVRSGVQCANAIIHQSESELL
ncbi:MAG TPA: hydroxysqualene dehydroxylase HpnE [Methylophilaceae bacterium]|nr:hydroxysqualene dehydroxylase HpnE [Methylophilaceae bacterium]